MVNVAILIDGKRPIGAKARRIPELKLVLNLATSNDAAGQVMCHRKFGTEALHSIFSRSN